MLFHFYQPSSSSLNHKTFHLLQCIYYQYFKAHFQPYPFTTDHLFSPRDMLSKSALWNYFNLYNPIFKSTIFSILRVVKAMFNVALLLNVLYCLSQRVGVQKILFIWLVVIWKQCKQRPKLQESKNTLKWGGGAGDSLVIIENPNVFIENMNLAMKKWLIVLFCISPRFLWMAGTAWIWMFCKLWLILEMHVVAWG